MPKRKCKPLKDISKRHRRRIIFDTITKSTSSSDYLDQPSSPNNPINVSIPSTSTSMSTLSDSDSDNNSVCISDIDFPNEEIPFFIESLDLSNNDSTNGPVVGNVENGQDLCDELAVWATLGNVSQSNLNGLLCILKRHKCFKDLPKDSRTLLKTPKSYTIKSVSPGIYYYFGIESGIMETIKNLPTSMIPNSINLHINVDGIPIAKSSGSQFWPILGAINLAKTNPFVIALYHGLSKPNCCNDFLHDFVEEANQLLVNGITYKNQYISIKLSHFTCDAPARAFIKKIKNHNGYYGCDKCVTKGSYVEGRVVFPDSNAELRNDEGFSRKTWANHHVGHSILEKIEGIKMITNFPNDYMHSICLGAMRKLLLLWIRGKLPIRLGNNALNQISTKLLEIKSLIPSEFARKPRSLKEIDRWKATELRQLLLYTGPFVLKHYLPKKNYTHYLSLNCAIRILISPELATTKLREADDLLNYFFKHFNNIYGTEQLSYNIHSIIHLPNDVRVFGPLDAFSAFKFENYLQSLKKKLRNCVLPLQQVIRRILEERSISTGCQSTSVIKPFAEESHSEGPLVESTSDPQFKKFTSSNFTISLTKKDNCIQLKDGSICLVENIATSNNTLVMIGKKFLTKTSFFSKPVPSNEVGIYKVSDLSRRCMWSTDDVVYKALNFPIDATVNYIAVLMHHE